MNKECCTNDCNQGRDCPNRVNISNGMHWFWFIVIIWTIGAFFVLS